MNLFAVNVHTSLKHLFRFAMRIKFRNALNVKKHPLKGSCLFPVSDPLARQVFLVVARAVAHVVLPDLAERVDFADPCDRLVFTVKIGPYAD